MAQLAMQQTMDEITDYLATIDEKVDDVLRAQKDAVVADMIGVEFVIEEAMTIREQVGLVRGHLVEGAGHVGDDRANPGYALLQLDATRGEAGAPYSDQRSRQDAKEAESKVQEWLAVLARCFQLQDAIAVLELDRVLDASPDDWTGTASGSNGPAQPAPTRRTEHRAPDGALGGGCGDGQREGAAAPDRLQGCRAVEQRGRTIVVDFHGLLGIEDRRQSLDARRWVDAATEAKDKAFETGVDGIDVAKRLGQRNPRPNPVRDREAYPTASPTERSVGEGSRTNAPEEG